MVGLYSPTEIDLVVEQIETCLSQWAEEVGVRQSEIIALASDIKDILNDHLYNGGD